MDAISPRRTIGHRLQVRAGGRRTLRRTGTGLAAGVVVAIGLSGLAACGAASAQDSADSAAENLSSAKVASFTLRLADPKNSLASAATGADDRKNLELVKSSSVRFTVDPPGDTTIGATQAAAAGTDPAAALKDSGSMEMAVVNAGKDVVALRMVSGVMCVRADLAALSTMSGEDVSGQLAGAPAELAPAVNGLKAGKWLCLDLPALIAKNPQLSALASGAGGQVSAQRMAELRTKLMAALNANSTRTVSTADGQTVVTMQVKAKPFLTSVLDTLGSAGLPGTSSLSGMKSEISSMSDGTVKAALTVKDGHYVQTTLDLHSVALLGTDAEAKAGTDGVELVADIDDSAASVSAPAAGDSVNLNSLVETMLSGSGSGLLSGLTGMGLNG